MFQRSHIITLLLVCAAAVARADQIIMVNGDRLSGRVQKLEGGKLQFTSDMAGAPLTLPWTNIRSIVSNQPLYVMLKDGRVFTGSILDSKEGMRLQDSNSSEVVPRDSIVGLRSFDEQMHYARVEERKEEPHFLDPWTGYLDLGLSLVRGNADATTYTVNGNGVRTKQRNKVTMYFNSLYARNQALSTVTADLRRGGIRWEWNLSPKQFTFVSGDFEADALQQLNLRAVGGAGLGRHVLKTKRHTLDLFAGATANHESFYTLSRLTAEALLSEETSHKISNSVSFKQKISVFPNLTEFGQYRITADSSAVTNVLRWLAWQVTFSDRYLSNPIPGSVRNDILVSTGIRFTLSPPKI
jgi:putative salt-induced outer membrane protein YdiY